MLVDKCRVGGRCTAASDASAMKRRSKGSCPDPTAPPPRGAYSAGRGAPLIGGRAWKTLLRWSVEFGGRSAPAGPCGSPRRSLCLGVPGLAFPWTEGAGWSGGFCPFEFLAWRTAAATVDWHAVSRANPCLSTQGAREHACPRPARVLHLRSICVGAVAARRCILHPRFPSLPVGGARENSCGVFFLLLIGIPAQPLSVVPAAGGKPPRPPKKGD